jgi:hypothetical protein
MLLMLEAWNAELSNPTEYVLLATIVMSIFQKSNLTGSTILDLDRPCVTFATDCALSKPQARKPGRPWPIHT